MLHLFLVWSGGVTNIQDKPDMPHRATYFCKEDSSPEESCDEFCLILEKSWKQPLSSSFTQVVGEGVCKWHLRSFQALLPTMSIIFLK